METAAILEGLQKGILLSVGLDVLEEEVALREERELLAKPFLENANLKTQLLDHVLLDMPNVIITPHIAFYTREAVAEILKITVENIKSFLAGAPTNLVK